MKGAYVSPTWSMAERLEHHSMPEPNSGAVQVGRMRVNAKLSDEAVRIIRSDPRPSPVLAAIYGVHRNTVLKARKGEQWKHVK